MTYFWHGKPVDSECFWLGCEYCQGCNHSCHDKIQKEETKMANKPFDWEKAKAGDPVVDIHGNPVTQLVKFDVKDRYCYRGIRAKGFIDAIDAFTGRDDLFMAPVKKTVELFINLYRNANDTIGGYVHSSQDSADYNPPSVSNRLGGKAHKVTIEYEE